MWHVSGATGVLVKSSGGSATTLLFFSACTQIVLGQDRQVQHCATGGYYRSLHGYLVLLKGAQMRL
jgi:hypothetical protein